jgi:hypothetical protein
VVWLVGLMVIWFGGLVGVFDGDDDDGRKREELVYT